MDTQTHTDTTTHALSAQDSRIHPIPLKHLHVSPLNMRAEKKEPNLKRMAVIAANILPTVREKGILTPLIVRPNNTGFEIVAGRRRYYAARVIEGETGSFPNIRCDVREGISDAEALDISLTENLAREDADELTYYEAFLSLTLKGRSVGEIARTYGKKEREVEQYLAIANLLPRIRELYRDEELDKGDMRLLTMATKTQQREWLKLFADNECPTGNDLKGWLFGGAAIRTKFALFDLAPFAKKITGDLFSEDSFFTDANTFWEAQDAAISERRDQYLAAKWAEVVVLERGQPPSPGRVRPCPELLRWRSSRDAAISAGRRTVGVFRRRTNAVLGPPDAPQQAIGQGVTTAGSALRSGDQGGSGHSIDLSEGD